MPRKPPVTKAITGPVALSDDFWKSMKSVGVPDAAHKEVERAILTFILEDQYQAIEPKRDDTKNALKKGIKHIEAARDWLREHDLDYMNVAVGYLYERTPKPPSIEDYVASLDALATAMHRAMSHETDRTDFGPRAWAGHQLAERISAALENAGCEVNDTENGVLVLTLEAALREAPPSKLPKNIVATARNWARSRRGV